MPFDLTSLSIYDYVGHMSYALVATSFLLRDILLLRLVAIVAAAANILFALMANAAPNFIAAGWQALFILINVGWSVVLIRERRNVRFDEDEQELYESVFAAFTPVEFRKLIRLADWHQVAPGEQLAAEGVVLDHIDLIFNGAVTVRPTGGRPWELRDGAFIGEMSFVRGGAATADVYCAEPSRVVRWPKEALKAMLARNPAMRATLIGVFGQDMAAKLISEGRAAH